MCYLKNVMQQHKFKAKHDQVVFTLGTFTVVPIRVRLFLASQNKSWTSIKATK